MCACMYACMHARAHTRAHTHTHTHNGARKHTQTNTAPQRRRHAVVSYAHALEHERVTQGDRCGPTRDPSPMLWEICQPIRVPEAGRTAGVDSPRGGSDGRPPAGGAHLLRGRRARRGRGVRRARRSRPPRVALTGRANVAPSTVESASQGDWTQRGDTAGPRGVLRLGASAGRGSAPRRLRWYGRVFRSPAVPKGAHATLFSSAKGPDPGATRRAVDHAPPISGSDGRAAPLITGSDGLSASRVTRR